VTAINAGRIGAARQPLRLALSRSRDEAVTGAIEASLAYVEAETGNPEEAMRLCVSALSRRGLGIAERGSIHSQYALLSMLGGRNVEAMEEFGKAIGMLSDSPLFLGRAYVNRGNLYLQQNDIARAESDFAIGLIHLRDADAAPPEIAMAEHNLGYTRFLGGDLAEALRDLDSARTVLAPLSPVAEATCDQDRAEVLMAAGLVAEGRRALAGAARAYGSRRLRRRQAEAELTLARSLVVDDPAAAVTYARAARRHFQAVNADAWRVRADAVVLAAEVEMGKATPSLLTRGSELSLLLEEQDLHWLAVDARLHTSRVRLRRGDLDGAGVELTKLKADAAAPLAVRLLDRDVRADLAGRRGRRSDALGHLTTGLSDLHAWQSSFGSLDLQTMVIGHGVRLARRGLRLAVDSGSAPLLFEWSERARMLASRVQPVRAPQDGQTVADLTELRSGPTPAREAELRQRVRQQAWQQRGSGEVAEPVSLATVQAGLGAETALIAYVATADRMVALVVSDSAIVRHELADRATLDALLGGLAPDLDVAAADLPDAMTRLVRRELADRLRRLAAVLVAPLLGDVRERRVVLTPSGVLAGVPWTLIPGFVGRPVTVARSATSWLARSTTSPAPLSAGFVAGPRVPRAEAEVTAASRAWGQGAQILTGPGATATAVSELAGRVDVLHVAAHGRHSAEHPLFSALELADGSWFGYDIDQLPGVPQVVLLSACELGRSSVRHGEELIGMTSAWLHAGAQWVVASPTAVNDAAAHDAFVSLHAGLRAGLEPPDALAALRAAPEGAPAPFVCFA
jgi:hypothetical protein